MSLTKNMNRMGRARQIEKQEQADYIADAQAKFSEQWTAIVAELDTLLGTEFDFWWDSYPAQMSKSQFLPIMLAKVAELKIDNDIGASHKTISMMADAPEVAPWGEDLGARFIISGGEVLELDSHLESAYDERNGDIETDMTF